MIDAGELFGQLYRVAQVGDEDGCAEADALRDRREVGKEGYRLEDGVAAGDLLDGPEVVEAGGLGLEGEVAHEGDVEVAVAGALGEGDTEVEAGLGDHGLMILTWGLWPQTPAKEAQGLEGAGGPGRTGAGWE